MKKVSLVLLMVLAVAGFALAQMGSPTTDVLGAHLNYGRGCAGCHAPHSGAYGNGAAGHADTGSGNIALWGQDVAGLFTQTITTGQTEHGNYPETLPGSWDTSRPDVAGLLTCLSCHDGNYAQGAMMKNTVYETLPNTYGTKNTIPTLLGADNTTTGNYLNDHPVGLAATVECNSSTYIYGWDCTETSGVISMTGPKSSEFVTNYGFFVSLSAYNNTAVVTCTTCHNQHLMNVVNVKDVNSKGVKVSGLPEGAYKTMFFIRAPYNPANGGGQSNQTAQFCRQCHGYEANEMNGGDTIPTTF